MPEITVCLPSYNCAEFIGQAIESVLAQDYKGYELIIIDSSSTDDSWAVINKYSGPNIIKIQCEYNKLMDKLNMAFHMAKGNYLTWICTDDLWKENFLRLMHSVMKSDPRIDLLYADYYTLRLERDAWVEKGHSANATAWEGMEKLYNNNHCGIFWLFKKEMYDKLGDFSDCSAEDYDYLLRAAEGKYKLSCFPMKLAIYREHPGQSVARLDMKKVREGVINLANKRGNYGK